MALLTGNQKIIDKDTTNENKIVKETTEEIINECNALAIKEYRYNIFIKDGVAEYLDYLKKNGIKIALATASTALS